VNFADFRQVTRSRSFSTVITRHDLLRQASIELVRTLLPVAMGLRLLGVTVSNFDLGPISAVDVECAPAGGQFERKDLTQPAGLPEDGSHDEIPISQCCIQAAGR
jgi:DNA polymerase IV